MQRNLERLRVENENDVKSLISLVRSTKSCMEEAISLKLELVEEVFVSHVNKKELDVDRRLRQLK